MDKFSDPMFVGATRQRKTVLLPSKQVQHIWHEINRYRSGRIIAVIGLSESYAALNLADDLAQMASLDPNEHVLVANVTPINSSLHSVKERFRVRIEDFPFNSNEQDPLQMANLLTKIQQVRDGNAADGLSLIMVASESPLHQPGNTGILQKVDHVVLTLQLGQMDFSEARRAIDMIGEEKIIGAVTTQPRSSSTLRRHTSQGKKRNQMDML